ncbi:MAG: DNA repair protein RecN [Shimia sp.]
MLRGLDIRDILIIDRLELDLQPGLNVLTGETGAGKSILLDALGFVLGWRGRAELVRTGAAQGEVTAWFDLTPDHPAQTVLTEAGFAPCDELILRRVNAEGGRKTAWVNDRRASGDVLRALSDTLVELHGQHDDRGLLDTRGHRALLDQFGGLEPKVEAARKAWRSRREAARALADAEARIAKVAEEEDFLRHAVAELDALAPEPGEEATLDSARRRMQAAERIRTDVARAAELLGGGAESSLGDAARWLDGVVDQAEGGLDPALTALNRVMVELAEAQAAVEGFQASLDIDPLDLERTEERLFAIRGLARKHGVAPDDLATFADGLRAKVQTLDAGAQDLAGLRAAVEAAEGGYAKAAEALSAARAKAAKQLDKAMAQELKPLKMERAVFETRVSAGEPGPEGRDAVAFMVATNPGAPSGALNKIASGGELSRFLLALKVCLASDAPQRTMIFDEIDRGVGGATADAVGRRLSALAEGGQVLVVTHSPQVAALGAHHWQVAKRVSKGATLSAITPLTGDARVDEVARMLAGDTITEEARGAARALLQG